MEPLELLQFAMIEEFLSEENVRVFIFADRTSLKVFLDVDNAGLNYYRHYFTSQGSEVEIIRGTCENVPFAGIFCRDGQEQELPLHVYIPKTGHHFYGVGFFMRSIINGVCTGFSQEEFKVFLEEIQLINHEFMIESKMTDYLKRRLETKIELRRNNNKPDNN